MNKQRRSPLTARGLENTSLRPLRELKRREATPRLWVSFQLPFEEDRDGSVVFNDSSRQEARFLQATTLFVSAALGVPTFQLIATLIAIGGDRWLLVSVGMFLIGIVAALLVVIHRRFSVDRFIRLRRGGTAEVQEKTGHVERIETLRPARLIIHRVSLPIGHWRGWGLFLHAGGECYALALRRRRARVEQYLTDLPPLAQSRFRGEGETRILTGV